ncbi:MAG: NUDIX domain-containing protein [Hyphomicrobium sp.]|nr:NUDIX domain-containing protein [Hyphomicrobium sp.]
MSEESERPRPTHQTFKFSRNLYSGFFRLDEYRGQYERYDGSMTEELRLEVFERGDSVSAILFDPLYKEVILVEQFRLPTVKNGQAHGWIIEPAAGMQRDNETVEQCATREIREETGYQVSSLVPISTFFVSPGGTTERIHLFYAEVRRTQQVEQGGGVAKDGENTRILRYPVTDFFARLRNREFEDAKLLIGGYWLKDRLASLSSTLIADWSKEEFELDLPLQKGWFGRDVKPRKFVGYISGDIRDVKGIDVWVNPLTSDMLLDKFSDRSISAAIRAGGAKLFASAADMVEVDTIGDELRRMMGDRVQVKPGRVLSTSAGRLKDTHGVQKIVHVAIAHGPLGQRPKTSMELIETCVDNVLTEIDKLGYGSALIPMIGTGPHGITVAEVAPRLLKRVIDYFKAHPDSKIEHVFVLAFSAIDIDELDRAFKDKRAEFKPHPLLAAGSSDDGAKPEASPAPPGSVAT